MKGAVDLIIKCIYCSLWLQSSLSIQFLLVLLSIEDQCPGDVFLLWKRTELNGRRCWKQENNKICSNASFKK